MLVATVRHAVRWDIPHSIRAGERSQTLADALSTKFQTHDQYDHRWTSKYHKAVARDVRRVRLPWTVLEWLIRLLCANLRRSVSRGLHTSCVRLRSNFSVSAPSLERRLGDAMRDAACLT
ncbi:hypothetical protein BS47DRAFT_1353967 [Hydnum rufescens UP504]|uniref:Uncharacterized protein n=1 Tax=Hydnum rufescens UP504 TaxID=1448309 RepID=A0A9P6DNN4_9AGAM|nr:hypothetical protein BS47DRAFT_1353967 [Hydnum rufescens UP504]